VGVGEDRFALRFDLAGFFFIIGLDFGGLWAVCQALTGVFVFCRRASCLPVLIFFRVSCLPSVQPVFSFSSRFFFPS